MEEETEEGRETMEVERSEGKRRGRRENYEEREPLWKRGETEKVKGRDGSGKERREDKGRRKESTRDL